MRMKVVKLKGQAPKYTIRRRRDAEQIDVRMADMASGAAKVNHSRYWGVRFLEEKEKYGPVKVYGPDGSTLVREIPKEALDRPFPVDPKKHAWNNSLFTKVARG